MSSTFGARVMDFYQSLERFRWMTDEVALLSPVSDERRQRAMAAFCDKFYGDNQSRVFWLGINPSRIRNTSSGVPYTDGYALETHCGIHNEFSQRRELTADFFYRFIESFGGAKNFYSRHYAGAAFPLSILKKDKYCNYYDKDLPCELVDSIPLQVQVQAEIGNLGVLIIIGSGKNAEILTKLNEELSIFREVLVVEHPRYIMQYKSANIGFYIEKYIETARKAESLAGFNS